MKLIDKIQQATSGKPDDYSRIYNPTAEVIEKISDDFALEFAEWIDEIRVERRILYDTSSIKELLEIYKEEKGL